jgi:hypothetical protein
VRLDHLLSKEHFSFLVFAGRGQSQYIGVCPVLDAHGWNVDYSAGFVCLHGEYCFFRFGGRVWKADVGGWVWLGTLLGV